VTAAIEATELGHRYGARWALRECTFSVPSGRVVALVGANGSGKTTLLHVAVGLLAPSEGEIRVGGERPALGPAALARIGFVAQDAPLYGSLSVDDHLQLGRRLNPAWDHDLAQRRVDAVRLDRTQKAGHLSGGQRAQLALTLAIAKRPEVLVLDEPAASLDPLARRDLLASLMEAVAEQELTVVLSSHLVADLERVCDFVVVLADGRVRLSGDVDELLAEHRVLTGARRDPGTLPSGQHVIRASGTDRQTTVLVRTREPIVDPAWSVSDIGLEDMVLAYMARGSDEADDARGPTDGRHLEVRR
jgi:ABC-2 type transport system ATP-binding protein